MRLVNKTGKSRKNANQKVPSQLKVIKGTKVKAIKVRFILFIFIFSYTSIKNFFYSCVFIFTF